MTSKRNVVMAGPIVAAGRITVFTQPMYDPNDPSYVRSEFMFTPDLKSQVSSDFPEHAKPSSLASSGDVVVAWGTPSGPPTPVRDGDYGARNFPS